MDLEPIKLVKCKNCGADVIINANYPINAVENCKNCGLYGQTEHTWRTWRNNDEKWQKFLKPILLTWEERLPP